MFLTALILAAMIQPDRWIHVGGSTDLYEEYLDTDSVKRSGDKVTVWTRRDLARDQGTAWNEIEFDCSRRTETILAWIRDDGRTVTHNVVRPHRKSSPIPPQSVEERIFKLACR